jgi:hypothetical protein
MAFVEAGDGKAMRTLKRTSKTREGPYLARQLSGFVTAGKKIYKNACTNPHGSTRDTQDYTGSGLRRVIPYVQFERECSLCSGVCSRGYKQGGRGFRAQVLGVQVVLVAGVCVRECVSICGVV